MSQSQGPSSSSKSQASTIDPATKASGTKAGSKAGGSGSTANKGSGQGQEMTAPIQEQAGQLLKATREQATGQILSQKDRVASSLGVLADTLHQAGQQVRDQDDAAIAGYVDSAADQIDRLSTTLREQNLSQLVDSTFRFGRKEPGLFLAATFALGFVGLRFLKSGSGNQGKGTENGQAWSGSNSGYSSGNGEFWNDSSTGQRFDQYGGESYSSESASSRSPRADDYAMRSDASQVSRSDSSASSPSSSGADTMVGSDWTSARDYDTGSEGL